MSVSLLVARVIYQMFIIRWIVTELKIVLDVLLLRKRITVYSIKPIPSRNMKFSVEIS